MMMRKALWPSLPRDANSRTTAFSSSEALPDVPSA